MNLKSTLKTVAVIGASVAILAACGSGPRLVPAGKLAFGNASVTFGRDWSDIGVLSYHKAKKVRILSIDGPGLNRLYISDGLTSDDPLMVSPTAGDRKNAPAPRGKKDMSLSEQMEFVATSLNVLEYQKVETDNPKPVTVGDSRGVRFEFTAKTSDGLDIKGVAQAVSKGGLNYYIIYLAPAEHYFDARLKDALAVMDSAKV